MANILANRADLKDVLNTLKGNEQPIFGLMTPQHMVEHLGFTLQFSNGKTPQSLMIREEVAQKIKYHVTQTNKPIEPGFRAPMLPVGELIPLKYKDLHVAIDQLIVEINAYQNFRLENPEKEPINPTMGALTFEEWDIFHDKHIRHHLRQFGLMV